MRIARGKLRGIIQEQVDRLFTEMGDDPFTFKIDKYPPDIENPSFEQQSRLVHDVIQGFQGPAGQRQWGRVSSEFYNMSKGGAGRVSWSARAAGLPGIRQKYYSGWTDEDFISVIVAVEGSYSP